MKVTKQPKQTTVFHREAKTYVSEYRCPSCGVYIVGAGLPENVLRFRCDCGQELIANHREKL
jgi:predicted RNA-binding Zn-ribbon protein involved in translation (DUF1610 family)